MFKRDSLILSYNIHHSKEIQQFLLFLHLGVVLQGTYKLASKYRRIAVAHSWSQRLGRRRHEKEMRNWY